MKTHTHTSSPVAHHLERPSVRLALKAHTKPYHDRMETALAFLLRPLTVAAYRALLARFYGLYAPLEAALAPTLSTVAALEFSERRKAPLLARDLHTLGLTTTEVRALPSCPFLPALPDLAHALGCVYVLEGATLGGHVLSRYMHAQFGYTQAHGCAFFSSYGAAVGPMWQTFCTVLTETLTTASQREAAITAACATFATFERWMTEERRQETGK